MIERQVIDALKSQAASYKVLALVGARQVGKTTLAKSLFHHKPYVSLENPDKYLYALNDPRGFLSDYPQGAIIDEAQRVPHLFSYLQEIVDDSRATGLYILTGSNHFLLNQAISQSLAGRVSYTILPPFSLGEIAQIVPFDDNDLMIKGFYPPVYDQPVPEADWYRNYTQTYLERDVRQISQINHLSQFMQFMSLLAGRCGQELNLSALANEAGVDAKTIQSWIGILEASFLIYLLRPYHRNFNKTIVKRPKIYFTDTGLACSLLRITAAEQLQNHPLRGALFENMVVMEFIKKAQNQRSFKTFYFWRDKNGYEIDLIIDEADLAMPIEIKSAKTTNPSFFKNLDYWNSLRGFANGFLLYAGSENENRSSGIKVMNWRKAVLSI
jgi:predicted AAA+ superfamily ATPase